MKKYILLITVIIVSVFNAISQPQMMNYQGVARDAFGQPMNNTEITLKINVISGSADGLIIYSEIHHINTSKFGIFNVRIGAGNPLFGNFTDIIWASANHFVKLEMDMNGGHEFTEMGTTQLLSVPYAFHAQTAGSIANESNIMLKAAKIGVPSQTWSLFGNRNTNPEKDKFGTTDNNDLVFVTNNLERLRITADGQLVTPDGSGLELGGSLIVHGDRVDIDKDLFVGRSVYLNTNDAFSPPGQTINNGNFTVQNSSITTLTGELNVDGKTFLNSDLKVERFVLFKDGFQLYGNATFNSNLSLQGDFKINTDKFIVDSQTGNVHTTGNLIVGGNSTFKGNANVSGELNVIGNSTFSNLRISGSGAMDGQHVAVFENIEGGSADGIAIRINKEMTTEENNFITFYRKDVVAGRIEGYHHNYGDDLVFISDVINPMLNSFGGFFVETLGFESPFSINFGSMPKLSGGKWPSFSSGSLPDVVPPNLSAGSLPSLNFSDASFPRFTSLGSIPKVTYNNTRASDLIQPWTWFDPNWSSLISDQNNPVYKLFEEAYENDWKSLTDMGITELFIKAAEMELEANIKSEGITYGSKGADYAEWLPRLIVEDNLELGQVVGVFGGKISLNTENADQILVISSKPIVLGNMPDVDKEDFYEKVAFMGQVPTWVTGGVHVGDYILCSGRNDGAGIAVSPSKLKVEDIPRIVGKAWSSSSNSTLSLINVAIGLNRNDLVDLVLKQQNELREMESRLVKLELTLTEMLSKK